MDSKEIIRWTATEWSVFLAKYVSLLVACETTCTHRIVTDLISKALDECLIVRRREPEHVERSLYFIRACADRNVPSNALEYETFKRVQWADKVQQPEFTQFINAEKVVNSAKQYADEEIGELKKPRARVVWTDVECTSVSEAFIELKLTNVYGIIDDYKLLTQAQQHVLPENRIRESYGAYVTLYSRNYVQQAHAKYIAKLQVPVQETQQAPVQETHVEQPAPVVIVHEAEAVTRPLDYSVVEVAEDSSTTDVQDEIMADMERLLSKMLKPIHDQLRELSAKVEALVDAEESSEMQYTVDKIAKSIRCLKPVVTKTEEAVSRTEEMMKGVIETSGSIHKMPVGRFVPARHVARHT
jgi:ElaB/YqjD/DUF883 family membrane-anchored ribosome-binding protein